MDRKSVPPLSQWNYYAGGTSVMDGRHNYDTYVDVGGSMALKFSIDAKPGKRSGYRVWVWGAPPHYSHQTIREHVSTPQQGVSEAKKFLASLKTQNPSYLLPRSWKSAFVRRLPNGQVQVKISRGRR